MVLRKGDGSWTPAFKWLVGLVTGLLVTLAGAVAAKSYDNGERVTAVETQQVNDKEQLKRIDQNVQDLVNKLIPTS